MDTLNHCCLSLSYEGCCLLLIVCVVGYLVERIQCEFELVQMLMLILLNFVAQMIQWMMMMMIDGQEYQLNFGKHLGVAVVLQIVLVLYFDLQKNYCHHLLICHVQWHDTIKMLKENIVEYKYWKLIRKNSNEGCKFL